MKTIKLVAALLFVLTFWFAVDGIKDVQAVEVYKKTTDLISGPTKKNNVIHFAVGGNIQSIRMAKYTESNFSKVVDQATNKARTRINAFSLNCPGYYTVRIYSDKNSTKMVGYVQVYVSTGDINNNKCAKITPPPAAKPEPKPPNPTHPNPAPTIKETFKKPVAKAPTPEKPKPDPEPAKPKKAVNYPPKPVPVPEPTPAQPDPPPPPTFNEFCTGALAASGHAYYPDGTNFSQKPGGDRSNLFECCPTKDGYKWFMMTEGIMNNPKENSFQVNDYYLYDYGAGWETLNDTEIKDIVSGKTIKWPGVKNGEWYCGEVTDIESTYCDSGQNLMYDPELDECVEVETEGTTEDELPLNRFDEEYTKKTLYNDEMLFESGKESKCLEEGDQWSPWNDYPDCIELGLEPDPIDPDEPAPQIDCAAEPWNEECLPTCYCPDLEVYGAGLGFMCCVWDCPGLDAQVTQFENFLSDDLVGEAVAPEIPPFEAPPIPNIFDVLNDVDERKQPPITHDNPAGLDDAGFDANDVKMEAEEIPFREDPTGGFNVTDPLESLPEDGSDAPRPEDEKVKYPSSDNNTNGSTTEGKVNYPGSPGGNAAPPTGSGGNISTPGYDDSAAFPVP